MGEGQGLGVFGLFLLGLGLVGIASNAAGHLKPEQVHEGIFAAAAEATLSVIVVGVFVQWHQWRTSLREEKRATLGQLSEIREKIRTAGFLMDAHRSGRTWTEQTRELVMLIPRLRDILEAPNSHVRRSEQLKSALGSLEKLKAEYWAEHRGVAKLATDGASWDEICETVPTSKNLVMSDGSPLLRALDASINSLR